MTPLASATALRSLRLGLRARLRVASERGTALIEFTLVLPLLLLIVFGVIEFGHLVQERMILTNVSREGGSIASRMITFDPSLMPLLTATALPIQLDGPNGKIYVTRIVAGDSDAEPNPKIQTQLVRGSLGVASGIADDRVDYGLTPALYQRLMFDSHNRTADISEITVVEVFYQYRPITPFAAFSQVAVTSGSGGGLILSSRAVF